MRFRFRLTSSNSRAAELFGIPLSSGDTEIWPAPWETTPNRWPTAKPWVTPEVEKCLYFFLTNPSGHARKQGIEKQGGCPDCGTTNIES
jgi:hypothetical protein